MSVVGTSVLLGTIACTARGTRSVVGATSGLLSTVACTASGSGSVVGVAMSGGGGVVMDGASGAPQSAAGSFSAVRRHCDCSGWMCVGEFKGIVWSSWRG